MSHFHFLKGQSRSPRPHQRGVALLTALFVVALATITAVAMVSDAAISVRRSSNLQDSEQAQWYGRGVESWVAQLLTQEAQLKKNGEPDGLSDQWAQPVTLPVDHGVIAGHLEDLQGRFNLNNLASNGAGKNGSGGNNNAGLYFQQFTRLLENIPGIDPFAASELAPAIRDWIDADSDRQPNGGAEDDYYMALEQPYRAANQLMLSPSELGAVKGMTPELYAALLPYVTALPQTGTKINVNTAPLPVLASLSENPGNLQAFMKARLSKPAENISELAKSDVFGLAPDLQNLADVRTDYFELQADIQIGDGRQPMFAVLRRNAGANGAVTVISRSFGAE